MTLDERLVPVRGVFLSTSLALSTRIVPVAEVNTQSKYEPGAADDAGLSLSNPTSGDWRGHDLIFLNNHAMSESAPDSKTSGERRPMRDLEAARVSQCSWHKK